jgi:ATP-dependent Clp protease adaptor protein ClpS
MEFENKVEQQTSFSEEVQEPPQFRVVLLNDDFTTKDFVVAVLVAVFHKNQEDALVIMEDVHKKGRGVVGAYTYDIAATRCLQVHEAARQNGFPLRCVMEQL